MAAQSAAARQLHLLLQHQPRLASSQLQPSVALRASTWFVSISRWSPVSTFRVMSKFWDESPRACTSANDDVDRFRRPSPETGDLSGELGTESPDPAESPGRSPDPMLPGRLNVEICSRQGW